MSGFVRAAVVAGLGILAARAAGVVGRLGLTEAERARRLARNLAEEQELFAEGSLHSRRGYQVVNDRGDLLALYEVRAAQGEALAQMEREWDARRIRRALWRARALLSTCRGVLAAQAAAVQRGLIPERYWIDDEHIRHLGAVLRRRMVVVRYQAVRDGAARIWARVKAEWQRWLYSRHLLHLGYSNAPRRGAARVVGVPVPAILPVVSGPIGVGVQAAAEDAVVNAVRRGTYNTWARSVLHEVEPEAEDREAVAAVRAIQNAITVSGAAGAVGNGSVEEPEGLAVDRERSRFDTNGGPFGVHDEDDFRASVRARNAAILGYRNAKRQHPANVLAWEARRDAWQAQFGGNPAHPFLDVYPVAPVKSVAVIGGELYREKYVPTLWSRFAKAVVAAEVDKQRCEVSERWFGEYRDLDGLAHYHKEGFVWFRYLSAAVEQHRQAELADMLMALVNVVGEEGDEPAQFVTRVTAMTWLKRRLFSLVPDKNGPWRRREFDRLKRAIRGAKVVLAQASVRIGPIKVETELERRSAYIALGEMATRLEREGEPALRGLRMCDVCKCAVYITSRGYGVALPLAVGRVAPY